MLNDLLYEPPAADPETPPDPVVEIAGGTASIGDVSFTEPGLREREDGSDVPILVRDYGDGFRTFKGQAPPRPAWEKVVGYFAPDPLAEALGRLHPGADPGDLALLRRALKCEPVHTPGALGRSGPVLDVAELLGPVRAAGWPVESSGRVILLAGSHAQGIDALTRFAAGDYGDLGHASEAEELTAEVLATLPIRSHATRNRAIVEAAVGPFGPSWGLALGRYQFGDGPDPLRLAVVFYRPRPGSGIPTLDAAVIDPSWISEFF